MPAFYIVLEEPVPGINTSELEGRMLSRESVRLETLAREVQVPTLTEFFSTSESELSGLAGTDEYLEKAEIPKENWFEASLVIATIEALRKSLANSASAENSALPLELDAFQRALRAADKNQVRCHLAVDY